VNLWIREHFVFIDLPQNFMIASELPKNLSADLDARKSGKGEKRFKRRGREGFKKIPASSVFTAVKLSV